MYRLFHFHCITNSIWWWWTLTCLLSTDCTQNKGECFEDLKISCVGSAKAKLTLFLSNSVPQINPRTHTEFNFSCTLQQGLCNSHLVSRGNLNERPFHYCYFTLTGFTTVCTQIHTFIRLFLLLLGRIHGLAFHFSFSEASTLDNDLKLSICNPCPNLNPRLHLQM